MLTKIWKLLVFSALYVNAVSNLEKFWEHGRAFHGNKARAQFPSFPPPSTSIGGGGSFICVPQGTCISGGFAGTGTGIDPRIVTSGQVTPGICPAGQVACYPVIGGALCGQRFVTANNVDGPTTNGAFPWQAYIRNQTGFTGSGVLIDSLHILTAAHKVNLNVATPGNVIVNMGVYDPATTLTTSQQRTAVRIYLHENFDPTTLRNDIAVIRLDSPISLGYQVNVGTACLPVASTSYVGQRCSVSGWGRTSFPTNDAPTSPQKQVSVPIVSYDTCRASLAQSNVLGTNVDTFLDPNGELCAGGEENRDACTSDGGAPLVCSDGSGRFHVAGLVIWGKGCGTNGVYGVYVDVAKYRNWIDQKIFSSG